MSPVVRWGLVAGALAIVVFLAVRLFGGGLPVEVAAIRGNGVLQVKNVSDERVSFQVAKRGKSGWSYVVIGQGSAKRASVRPGRTWSRNLSKGDYVVVIGDQRSDVVTLTK